MKIAELSCPVALYSASTTSDRIAFHTLNRATGHRVRRQFVDSETGKPVDREEQAKGYEIGSGEYIVLDNDEIASAVPESDKTLSVSAFIPCRDVDDLYLDKPYYLTPADLHAGDVYALIRNGMRAKNVAALAQAVLFRRARTVLIQAHEDGLVANTLNFDYEVRSAKDAFDDIPDIKIKGEMIELAEHIIRTKEGTFDPKAYDDRYETALADLVKAKLEGKKIAKRKEPEPEKVIDLMAALRQSARGKASPTRARSAPRPARTKRKATSAKSKSAPPRRKAG